VALFPVSFRERGLRHASFKIAFPAKFVDQVKLLVQCGLASTETISVPSAQGNEATRVIPREVFLAVLGAQRTQPDGAPDDCDVLRVEARGVRDGTPVRITEEVVVRPYTAWKIAAGDADTGIPLALAGILLGSGEAALPGAHGAELVFDPQVMLRELARYDMHVSETSVRAIS
jgi:hypothetical protein